MVEGKHLGRFIMMQVPAVVVEKKRQISIRLHANQTYQTRTRIASIKYTQVMSACNTFSWGTAQVHVCSGVGLRVCKSRTKVV